MEKGRAETVPVVPVPDFDTLPAPIRERLSERIARGDAFGPPRSRKPKVDVRELVASLQRG